MIGVVLGMGALLALLAAVSKAHAATLATPGSVDDHVNRIVRSGDPTKMLEAAKVAHASGNRQLGADLANKARNAAAASPTAVYPSPFPDVATPEWSAFVHMMRTGKPDEVTPANYLGMFGMGMPRLVDLGLATNARKIKKGDKSVWTATWAPQLQPGPDKFLAAPALQYHVFRTMVTNDLATIREKMPSAIGSDVDGVKATASGLLAVSKQAGLKGLAEWLTSSEVRQKYPKTTAQFERANGIF